MTVRKSILFTSLIALFGTLEVAHAECEVVIDGKKEAFDGQSLQNLMVEKKSMLKLDQAFPALNVIEKVFKGDVITCSNCTDHFVICEN